MSRALAAALSTSAAAVRVRYAPSPTGSLHLGGLRTALYNYLFARHHGGAFVLRIEDTDRSRLVPGSVAALVRALEWCGVVPDEGPLLDAGGAVAAGSRGDCGPYVQSERLSLYSDAAAELLRTGHAYRCFCTPARLTALREAQASAGRPSLYDRACAHLPRAEADARAAAGETHVVRLRVPAGGGAAVVSDAVLGDVRFALAGVDDQVLLKSDGFPTYHLAAVVDDHAMHISHVIRGQEWLPSTPKHLLLHAALGWAPPVYAHLPLLLNAERGKLSKRAGDASVEDFRAAGYTPEALLNFVALLGWTPPPRAAAGGAALDAPRAPLPPHRGGRSAPAVQGAEVLTLDDMVAGFTLAGVHKANAVVDRARLDYFNGEHIRRVIRGARDAALRAADGRQGAAPPAALPSELVLAETAPLAALRATVAARIGPLLADLAAEAAAEAGSGAGTGAPPSAARDDDSSARLPPPLFNAALAAQHERVHLAADFAPLLVPFAATPSEFAAWRSRALAAASSGGGKLAKLALTEAPGAASPAAALRALGDRVGPALCDVADAWAALPAAAFSDGSDAPLGAAKGAAAARGLPAPALLLPLRLALTGLDVGATLSVTLALLGRETSARRARELAAALKLQ